MPQLDPYETLFVATAFAFQLLLIVYYLLRRRSWRMVMRYGPLIYATALPLAVVSLVLFLAGKPWWLWLGGLLALAWAGYGYFVDFVKQIPWREPIYPPVFFPYITLYLAMLMFYWWPLARFSRGLWLAFGALFVIASLLNVTSHGPRAGSDAGQKEGMATQ